MARIGSRYPGDLHLGQALRERGEWRIFDFEGEPGLLRSLGYTAAAPSARASRCRRSPGRRGRPLLDGYLAAVEGTDLLPNERGDAMALLHAMELGKALYEVRHEMGNRPDWADIPVAALLEGAP